MKTCILYARVSTTRQAHEYGLEAQLDNCRPWAEREGYMVLDEIADAGGDDSKRDVLNRPGLRRILEMVSERKVDAIIAVDRDRYGEHPVPDQLAGLLAASGTQMRALDDAGEGEDAEFLNGIKDLWARQERRKIAKRSRRGKLRKAREGKVLALGQPNFGYVYTVDRDGYVVDEEHMKLMRRIFKMLGPDGLSIHETRKTLDREGWPTPSRVWSECIAEERERKGLDPKPFSEKWSQPFIREAVRDDCYKMFTAEEVGELVLKGRMKPDVAARVEAPIGVWWYVGTDYDGNECRVAVPVPPSGVPREWLEMARGRIEQNERTVAKGGGRTWELSGGVFMCGGTRPHGEPCGWSMQSHSKYRAKGDSRRYHYYRCARRGHHGKEECDNGFTHRAVEIEQAVWLTVSRLLRDPEEMLERFDALVEQERARLAGDPAQERRLLTRRLSELEVEADGYVRLAASGRISDEKLDGYLAEMEERREALEGALNAATNRQSSLDSLESVRDALRLRAESYRNLMDEHPDLGQHVVGGMPWGNDVFARGLLGDPQEATPEERREFYREHGVHAEAAPDGKVRITGWFVAAPGEGIVLRRGLTGNHTSILLCTHDMDEAEELCDRVGIIMDGKIIALEEPENLKERYSTNGSVPNLEEVFMTATGYTVEEASVEE